MQVAVYGSLKAGLMNSALLIDSKFVNVTTIEGYDMYSVGHYPAITKGEGAIEVEVYEIDTPTLQRLDCLEGYHSRQPKQSYYRRVKVATSEGEALLYIFNNSTEGLDRVEPNEHGVQVWEEPSRGRSF